MLQNPLSQQYLKILRAWGATDINFMLKSDKPPDCEK